MSCHCIEHSSGKHCPRIVTLGLQVVGQHNCMYVECCPDQFGDIWGFSTNQAGRPGSKRGGNSLTVTIVEMRQHAQCVVQLIKFRK